MTLVWGDHTLSFIHKQIPFPWYERLDLSNIWPYGRVFETSSGYHGEFFTPNDPDVSLIHLGDNEQDANKMMQRLTEQHMYILSLKELQ